MGQSSIPAWAEFALDLLAWSFRQAPLAQDELDKLASRGRDLVPFIVARDISSLYYHATRENSTAQRVYNKVWEAQKSACLHILRCFQDRKAPALLFKGAEFISAWYQSQALGLMNDIDILVPRDSIGTAKQILYSEGFRQGLYDPATGQIRDYDVRELARIESAHYELAPFRMTRDLSLEPDEMELARRLPNPVSVVQDQYRVVIDIDIHHGVAADLPSEPFLQRAVPSATGLALTFSPTDHLWFTLARLYNEVALHGKVSLRDFAYVLPMLARAPIDWDLLGAVARQHNLRTSLFYYLQFLDHLTQGAIPPSVLDSLHPALGHRSKDWGWQLGKLLGVLDPYPLEGYSPALAN